MHPGQRPPLNGLHVAALSSLAYFRHITPSPFHLAEGQNADPIVMDVGLVPANYEIATAEVEISNAAGAVLATLPMTFHTQRYDFRRHA